jgi:membrane protease YdiL (CAAX protease family)
MNGSLPSGPGFWKTVGLLLSAARKRASGRRKRQRELLQQRSRGNATDWSGFSYAIGIFFMAALNVLAVFAMRTAVKTAERIEVERQGQIVVSSYFRWRAAEAEQFADEPTRHCEVIDGKSYCWQIPNAHLPDYTSEASSIAEKYGGDKKVVEQKLKDSFAAHGARDFVAESTAEPGLGTIATSGPLPAMLGSLVLFWWAIMLAFQGEGLELDLQRRRHPMWEWLFSHPVPPGAVFLAETLSPLAANPIYWCGPLFVGGVYWMAYDMWLGVLATLVIGVPVTVAAACLGKALEVGTILRFPPRSRGAMIGLMSWMGYAALMLFFVGTFVIPKVVTATAKALEFVAALPWPELSLFLGARADGSFSFLLGVTTCWIFAGIVIAGSVWFSVWATQRGLSGNFGVADARPRAAKNGATRFGKEPLYRKEFLWFIRDRSAIVQTLLIPLTVASVQAFNLRGLLAHAQDAWNYLCGSAILFGTYFLWILGPKSLASEGTALWIALTWPRGLENLLKAKAWLWSLISSGLVLLVLGYAAYLFPVNIWQIALVGVGWFFFGRSMAEKTVTLVRVASSSGETEPIPRGRMWAAQLGMLTFAIGILTQRWHIAIMGIVYSYITAAAMWQNFRARLPYLYDPWSEEIPPPPTLMHAMIAISILVEGGAVLTGIFQGIFGRENIAIAQAMSYGVSAVVVSFGMSRFLAHRDVYGRDVWFWREDGAVEEDSSDTRWKLDRIWKSKLPQGLLLGIIGGVGLGLFARGYLAVLQHIPGAAEVLRKSQEEMAKIPNLRVCFAVMAILFAPFAEEYLFRGLLYRALDREWGGWRAVLGSAAFFAIYHSPYSWLPVAIVGAANALLFKKTRHLAPAVALHMIYNAVVTLWK